MTIGIHTFIASSPLRIIRKWSINCLSKEFLSTFLLFWVNVKLVNRRSSDSRENRFKMEGFEAKSLNFLVDGAL